MTVIVTCFFWVPDVLNQQENLIYLEKKNFPDLPWHITGFGMSKTGLQYILLIRYLLGNYLNGYAL